MKQLNVFDLLLYIFIMQYDNIVVPLYYDKFWKHK
jgi:hypothetical protein